MVNCFIANCNLEVYQDGYCIEHYKRRYNKQVKFDSKTNLSEKKEKSPEQLKLEDRIAEMRAGLDKLLSGAKNKEDLARISQDVMKAEMALSIIKDIMEGKWDQVPLTKKLSLFKDMLKATTPILSAPSFMQFNLGQVKEVQAKTAKSIINSLPKPTVSATAV